VIEKMERETGFEPATSSLGIQAYIESKSLARFCCEFLNLQRLAKSPFSKSLRPNEAQSRQMPPRGSFSPNGNSARRYTCLLSENNV
jgi:hypothetical protein